MRITPVVFFCNVTLNVLSILLSLSVIVTFFKVVSLLAFVIDEPNFLGVANVLFIQILTVISVFVESVALSLISVAIFKLKYSPALIPMFQD